MLAVSLQSLNLEEEREGFSACHLHVSHNNLKRY